MSSRLNAGWQGARPGAEIPLDLLNPPRVVSGPDYARLIEVLMSLRQSLDPESGETILTTAEAASIRACGFEARAGRWRCPLLPDDLVWFRPVLCAFSDAIGPELRQGSRWHPRRAAVRSIIGPMDPLSKIDRRLLAPLRKGPLPKRRLQQTFGRDFGAATFNPILNRLVAEGYALLHGVSLYLTRRGAAGIGCEMPPAERHPNPESSARTCYAL